jgi:hypothetical protein
VDQAPLMITGLKYFVKKVVTDTDIIEMGEKETVKWACKAVMDMCDNTGGGLRNFFVLLDGS